MRRILALVLFLVVLVMGLFFGILNAGPVTVNYYLGTWDLPLSLLLVITLLIGALLGAIAGLGWVLKMKRQIARLRKEARLAEKEVMNLRTLPIKDPQ